MLHYTFFVVDAFTTSGSGGNSAAVCFLDVYPPDGVMQQLAAEINFSETA